jgi:hypothetical protein
VRTPVEITLTDFPAVSDDTFHYEVAKLWELEICQQARGSLPSGIIECYCGAMVREPIRCLSKAELSKVRSENGDSLYGSPL